ncbi:protamine-2 [Artibeus jamaicensis]|uniref:protamine-2 n=1 Tax=Artibeus jamaicensis TaxID=9417 RepID=UPI00235A9DC1|nr:protamine-2 [Artibeus jamaicensis]
MVRHHKRSLSESPQRQGEEQEQDPNAEESQAEGRTLRGCYHYRRRHCSRRRRLYRRRRCSCRRRRRRTCRRRRRCRGSARPSCPLASLMPPGPGTGG